MICSIEFADEKLENFPILSSGEMHVWNVSLDVSDSDYLFFTEALSEKELSKVEYYNFQQVKSAYVASHGALRILISKYLGTQPGLLKIGHKRKGKPYSLDDPGLYFNMSNSGKLAVIVFSRDGEVGIDIEQIRSLPDLDEMIEKNFTPKEIKFILAKPEEKINRFFRFWTIKEAYLKAIGEGMRLRPDQIEFTIENNIIKRPSIKGVFEEEEWNLKEFSPPFRYAGAVAFRNENAIVKQWKFKPN